MSALAALSCLCSVHAGGRADWLRGSVGVSVHWTASIPAADGSKVPFEEAVRQFDVKAFADALASVRARHLIFTTSHGLQCLPMPNAALDAIEPGRTTMRDLFGEILDACAERGIRVIAYYNHSCNAPGADPWKRACACPFPAVDRDVRPFASNICAIVRCMSERYGRKLSGWWFDSSYSVDSRGPRTCVDGIWHEAGKNPYRGPEVVFPWDDLIAAARSGNPDAAVAINAGVARTFQCSAGADYYAGETAEFDEEPDGPIPAGLVDTRWTTLDDPGWTFDAKRGFLPLRKSSAELRAWTLDHLAAGRAVTFNVLIDRAGRLNPAFAALKDVFAASEQIARTEVAVHPSDPEKCVRRDVDARVRVSLGGKVRAKMDTFLAARIFGPEAKGRIYEEAVNAFRTHYDDVRTPEQDAVRGWKAGKGLWQGEYWGKSMLAAVSVAEHAGDAELKAWLKEKALAFVKEFQRQDGYLGSYKDPHFIGGPVAGKPGEEIFCWNLWGRKYTMWALLEISRITETPELLVAARKVMDQWMAQLAERNVRIKNTGYFVGLPSMSVLKPLLLLHRATDDEKYLAYADSIVAAWERRGNPAPNLIANAFGGKLVSEWYANPGWWAKAYEMMSCLEGLVAYSQVRRQPRVLEAVERIVSKLEEGELNAVGGVGFFDHFTHAAACPNATTEPCDVTHWIRVNRELFLVTGKAHYLDNIEFAFYNAFLAGVYRDGKWGAHSVRSHGTRHLTAPHQVGMKYHQCCIDNMPRTFVDFAQTVLSRGEDGCLSVNLYSDAKGTCGSDAVEISGGYPFGDVVAVRVSAARKGSVRFRRPSWFDAMAVNGTDVKGDWLVLSLEKGENRFTLSFARSARVVDARPCCSGGDVRADGFEVVNENPEMKGRARKTPAARLVYGPLLLAKAKCLGDAEEEILDFATVNGRGYSCRLKPLEAQGVDGAWTATFTKGSESFSVKVCDFATAADSDDPSNLFSIWF